MLKRFASVPLALLMISSFSISTMAQPASPEAREAVDDHLAWVLSLFEGGADDLTADEVEARFDTNLLTLVPPEEFIPTVQQLAGMFGQLELVEEQDAGDNEFVGVYQAESGDMVMLSLAVDPGSGLIAGLFLTPAESPGQDAAPAASPEASPAAAPVAQAPVIEDASAQISAYQDKVDAIREIGEPVRDAVLAGDDAALEPLLAPEVASLLADTSLDDVLGQYTTRQVQMAFPEAGIVFFGQWTDAEISGLMVQSGVPYVYTLTAQDEQGGDLPTGTWSGMLPEVGLELQVTFTVEDSGDLSATVSIPMQGLADAPLSDVQYMEERPIGDMVDERIIAPGGASDSYTADFVWGDHLLRLSLAIDPASGMVNSLQVLPAIPTPQPENVPASDTAWQLPFEGTWWVLWGGEDELRNYHVSAPSQFYAYDLVIWNDGASWEGEGTANEDYWAWGQQVLAPASGEVVAALGDEADLPPNASVAERSQGQNPVGNHVVIQTAENEYVVLAHLQQRSVQVEVGDQVESGDALGLVGNSGNSTEPHLHLHAQDSADMLDYAANGIPVRFDGILIDGEPADDALPIQGSFIGPE